MAKRNRLHQVRPEGTPFDPAHEDQYFEDTGRGGKSRGNSKRADRFKDNAQGATQPHKPAANGNEQAYVKNIQPKSEGQARLIEAIDNSNLVLALGPAGTGKTYIAIAKAVDALRAGKIGRIVLCRPAVDAGENIGFLPGDMEEKLAPYLRPLYDALQDRMSTKQVKSMIAEGQIEIASLGFMRGRTLNNAFIVVDEAQNCTYTQLKMVLTRLGWNSKMIVTGDPDQCDLPPLEQKAKNTEEAFVANQSGLDPIAKKIEKLNGDISVVRLQRGDVVRHPLVAKMLDVL